MYAETIGYILGRLRYTISRERLSYYNAMTTKFATLVDSYYAHWFLWRFNFQLQDGWFLKLKELYLGYSFKLRYITVDKGALSSLKKMQLQTLQTEECTWLTSYNSLWMLTLQVMVNLECEWRHSDVLINWCTDLVTWLRAYGWSHGAPSHDTICKRLELGENCAAWNWMTLSLREDLGLVLFFL